MKKSIAFLLASLAATSSLLFHTQEAKAGINDNDEWKIKIPVKNKLLKATFGRYKGDYVIFSEIPGEFNEPMRGVGKDEKKSEKIF